MSSTSKRIAASLRATWRHRANVFFGLVLLGVVVVVARNLAEGERVVGLVERAHPEFLLVGMLAQVLTYLCSAAIWYRIARRHSHRHVPFSTFVPLGFAKLFVDQMVPSAGVGGTVVVVRGLTSRGLSRSLATAAVLVDLVAFYVGQGVAVLLALVAVIVDGSRSIWIVVAASVFLLLAVAVPAAVFMVNAHGDRSVPRFVRRIGFVGRFLRSIARAPHSVVRDVPLVLECSAWQLAVIVLDGLTLGAMLYALGVHASVTAVIAAHALASAMASLGVVPGGLGVFEATAIATLRLLDVPLAPALAATLLARALTLWLPLIPGLVITRRETRRRTRQEPHRRPVAARPSSAGHAR